MKKVIIQVPSMRSEHCQLRVQSGLNKLDSANPATVSPGLVEVDYQNEEQVRSALQTIEDLGYTVLSSHINDEASGDEQKLTFKTNINCSGCVAKVKPFLDETDGLQHWEVDTQNPEKILTVQADGISEAEIMQRVQEAGFKIEPLKN